MCCVHVYLNYIVSVAHFSQYTLVEDHLLLLFVFLEGPLPLRSVFRPHSSHKKCDNVNEEKEFRVSREPYLDTLGGDGSSSDRMTTLKGLVQASKMADENSVEGHYIN